MRLSIFSIITMVVIFALASCDRDSGPVMSSSPGASSITSPESGDSYILTEDQADDTLLTMEWTEAEYGYDAGVEYSVQMDAAGNNFEAPRILESSTHDRSRGFAVSEMNSHLTALGFEANQPADVQLRVISRLHGGVAEPLYSEPVSLQITPYLVEVVIPEIYVPGNYQSASGYGNDWSPDQAPPLYSFENNDVYEGYVYIAEPSSEFKFTLEGNWDVNWGDGGNGTLESGGPDIVQDEAGYYRFDVDLNNLTFETLRTEWGLIGDATPDGWEADQDMTFDPENKVWTITLNLDAGEIKFRANDDWDLNYGDDAGDGTLSEGGANIPIDAAGNYTVILDLGGPDYTYEVNQN